LYSTVKEALDVIQNKNVPATSLQSPPLTPLGVTNNMTVPSNWTLHPQIIKFDPPRYTNIKYPFPISKGSCGPPLVPLHHNPTAIYTCVVTLPLEWFQNQSTTTTTTITPNDEDEYTILVHGIESAYYLFYNSQYIGFAKDSRLSSEFILPYHLHNTRTTTAPTTATIDIVVVKWCDGTYVEDQDHWYLSGTWMIHSLLCCCCYCYACMAFFGIVNKQTNST
jgi:beta-galactosidase